MEDDPIILKMENKNKTKKTVLDLSKIKGQAFHVKLQPQRTKYV
jgi:hypothetical protein